MAQIDPNIALSVRPLQLESPINQMAAMAQLQSAQQQQQMNALKLEEARRSDMERNELLKTISSEGFDLNNPAHVQNLLRKAPTLGMPYVKEARMALAEKARAEQESVKAEHEKFKMRREQLDFTNTALQNSTNPTLARAHIQQAIDLKYVSPEAGTQMLASVPEDPTEFEAWRANLLSHSMTAKDQLERVAPKMEKVDLNGVIKHIDVNPNSPTYGKEVLPEMAKTPSESDLARLQRERADIAKANANDPRLAQYDAAITKLTTQVSESDIARLQRERKDIEDKNPADPRLAQYDAAIAKLTVPTGESDLAKLQRERKDIADKNPNDPRLKDYDARIAKLVNPAEHLSDLARKHQELDDLRERLKKDPANKDLRKKITDYENDIRKDTTFKPPVINVLPAASKDLVATAILDGRLDPTKVNSKNIAIIAATLEKNPNANLKELSIDASSATAASKALATQSAKILTAANEADNMIKVVRNTAAKVDRTQYPNLNAIQNAVDKGTGGQEIVKLNTALNALVNSYARAINPTGVATVSDKNHAREIINSNYASGQLNAILDVMQEEMRIAKASPGEASAQLKQQRNAPKAKSDVRDKADAILRK